MKYIIFLFSILLFATIFSSMQQKLLKITFCDVGQGDATLISIGKTQLLIDAGPNSKVLECLEHQMPFLDKRIEFIVLTHMDSDHIGGAPQVLDYYDVDFLIMNPSNKQSSVFNLLELAVSRKLMGGTKVVHSFIGQKIRINDGLLATVIAPQLNFSQVENQFSSTTEAMLSDFKNDFIQEKLAKIAENDLSIALIIDFNNVRIFLPGDLESQGELAILKYGLLNRVDILKAGHHGSKSSSTPGFIGYYNPKLLWLVVVKTTLIITLILK
jgi:competence protein ComEC